jgi:hypothetical protein
LELYGGQNVIGKPLNKTDEKEINYTVIIAIFYDIAPPYKTKV